MNTNKEEEEEGIRKKWRKSIEREEEEDMKKGEEG